MRITIDLRKTVEQNAAAYFERAKKARRKIVKIREVLDRTRAQLAEAERQAAAEEQPKAKVVRRKPQWYEKFRWFVSSEGFLVIGGRDATSNEVIIKKHLEKDDLVFHTDMAGSPFFVAKGDSQPGKEIGAATIQEAINTTCSFSRAWGNGMATTRSFWVKPEQVSKTAEHGEYMGKGAFMIRGKTNYIVAHMDLAVGLTKDAAVMCGPRNAVEAHCEKFIPLLQGNTKTSDTAKQVQKLLGALDLDEVLRALPSGGCKIEVKRQGGKHA